MDIELKVAATVNSMRSHLTNQDDILKSDNGANNGDTKVSSWLNSNDNNAKNISSNNVGKIVNKGDTFNTSSKTTNITNNRPVTAVQNLLPRVRGLTNLGNTCFFNAVLQCLAQTPFLAQILKEASASGEE